MAFIGNTVQNQGFTPAIDYFNGNGVTVTFTLSRPIASVAQIIVSVDNVIQNPNSAFTVAGSSITFSSAPLSGTNNIWVEYTSLITTYQGISQDPTVIGDIRATGGYLAEGDFGNSFVDGVILDYVTGLGRITVGSAEGIALYNGGTSSRNALLTLGATGQVAVNSSGSAATPVISKSDDLNTGIFFPAADTIAFSEGGAEAMRIDSSGNVGIGTTTPTGKFEVKSANNTGTDPIIRAVSNNGTASTWLTFNGVSVSSGNACVFYNGTTERMRIDSSGRVLFGSTDTNPAVNNNPGVAINANADNNYYVGVIQASATGNTALFLNRGADDGNTASFRRSGTTVGNISVSFSGTSYNTTSDYRLKENIAPMTGALAVVGQLKPCIYTWKADGSSGQGFIAHELQTVVPDAVCGEKDAIDKDGNPEYQGVDTSFLVATLTAAIQEQQTLITSLTARIAALEAK